jgi:hypothetical protein
MKSFITSVLALLVLPFALADAASIKTVAVQGDTTPDPGFAYKKFDNPVVSDAAGQRVGVFARSSGGKRCIYRLDPDSAADATIECERTPSPDAGRAFGRFGEISINVTADIAWASRLDFGRQGVFRADPTQIVALLGDPVPPPGTGLLKDLLLGRITDANDVFFEATISGGAVVLGVEVDQGLFRCTGGDGNCSATGTGTLETVLLVNDAVADRPGREFCSFGELSASAYGVAFRAETKMDCANNAEPELEGVFRKPILGLVETLALAGEPAEPFPSPGGTTYVSPVGEPTIENLGTVAFLATSAGVTSTSALYICDPVGCPPALADAAVNRGDLDDDGAGLRAFSRPAISLAKDIAFAAKADPPNGAPYYAMYVRRFATTDIEQIARTNDTVPGLVPSAIFRFHLEPPSISAGGKIAFKSRIRRSVSPKNRQAVFIVESPSGAFLDDF